MARKSPAVGSRSNPHRQAERVGRRDGTGGRADLQAPDPRSACLGAVADAEIPFSFLDIVKGYRKIAGNVTPIPLAGGEGAFQAYPLVGPLMHFDTIEPAGGDEQGSGSRRTRSRPKSSRPAAH